MTSEKISLVILTRKTIGGIQKHIVDLAGSLDKSKYRITVCGPIDSDFRQKLDSHGIPSLFIDIADRIQPVSDIRSTRKLIKALKSLKPDILHIHGNKTAFVGRIAGRRAKINHVIVTVHNFLAYQEKGGLKSRLAFYIERRLAKSTSKIITVSNLLKSNLVKKEGIDKNKIEVIHNGIDLSVQKKILAQVRDQHGILPNDFLALNVARMVDFKGQEYLIKAISKVSAGAEIKLMIVGDGPLNRKLKKLVKRYDISDKVVFLNSTENISALYEAADCFVLSSINEPFGLVLLEAMAHKLPIIATKSGGVLDILDENNSILVEPKDEHQIAAAIERMAEEKSLTNKIANNAFCDVSDRFTLDKMVKETEKMYSKVLTTN